MSLKYPGLFFFGATVDNDEAISVHQEVLLLFWGPIDIFVGRRSSYYEKLLQGFFHESKVWKQSSEAQGDLLYRTFGKFPVRPSLRQNNCRGTEKGISAGTIRIYSFVLSFIRSFIHSLVHSVVSYDMSIASSKASSPHSAMQCFLFHFPTTFCSFKVIQQLLTPSSSSSNPFTLSLNNVFYWDFLCKMLPIQLSLLRFIVSVKFLSPSALI